MIVQIFNRDILEILTVYSLSPGSKFLRKELKEKTKMNNVNLDKAINNLQNSGIIKKEKKYFSLDLDNSRDIIKLISWEYKRLKELPLAIYFIIINITYFLSKIKDIRVYLFGSYAKLVYKDTSDIDILIVSDKITNKEKNELFSLIKKLELKYKKNVEIHNFETNFYKNKKDPFVQEILKNGVRLI